MLPKGTSLGRLRLDEVLDFYDGPRLLVARNVAGTSYLGLWVEDESDASVWLYVAVSALRLTQIKTGDISLRDAYLEAEDDVVFRVRLNRKTAQCDHILVRELALEELPPEGDCLKIRTPESAEFPALPVAPPVSSPRRSSHSTERLHVATMSPGHTLSHVAVTSVWGHWNACRESSLRALGLKGPMAKMPATAVQLQSFSVDLSLPSNEMYYRAIEGWAEFVGNGTQGDIRNALIRNKIESIACEGLLHAIVYFDLRLTVSLIPEHSSMRSRTFCIDATLANWLLGRLRTTEPVLSSDQIPQADELEEVEEVVRKLSSDAGTAEEESLDPSARRHANYYRQAARILGLVDSSGMLGVPGRKLVIAGTESARHAILRNQFEVSECGWAWMRWAKKDSLAHVSPSTALKFLRDCAPTLSASTVERRSKTLEAWHSVLFPMPTLRF